MRPEGLALQKLKHCRRKRFGRAVDFIDEQNPFFQTGFFHFIINRGDNFAHGVLCYGVFLPAVFLVADKRQADCALAGVVRDAVRNEGNAAFPCDLFHNGCFADARRAHQQYGALAHDGDAVCTEFILCEVRNN